MGLRLVQPDSRAQGPAAVRGVDPLAALAAVARRGDAQAIRTLVVAVTPAMLRAVRGVLGAHHREIEDTLQEAAIGLVRGLDGFRGDCTVTHFACRIAVLSALTVRRSSTRRHEDPIDTDLIEGSSSPAEEIPAGRRRRILRQLCDALPIAQSEPLILHCMLGFTVQEVADSCGAPPNTVRSRLRLAKLALRQRIESDPTLLEALEVDAL